MYFVGTLRLPVQYPLSLRVKFRENRVRSYPAEPVTGIPRIWFYAVRDTVPVASFL